MISTGINYLKEIAVLFNFNDNKSMKENSESKLLNTDLIFTLEVRIPDQLPKKISVFDQINAGLDPRNDLILIDPKIMAKHFHFEVKKNILTVQYLGHDGDTFLNGLALSNAKFYILEISDVLKVGKIEIWIRQEAGIKPPSAKPKLPHSTLENFNLEISDLKKAPPENIIENFAYQEMPFPKQNKLKISARTIFDFSTVKLIPYKVYGFIVDIALTYFILSFMLPKFEILTLVQDFFFPVSQYISQFIAQYISQFLVSHQNIFVDFKILSLIEFLFFFHSIMIFFSLILGTTPGAFLIGLHHKANNKSFLGLRFKAYLYSLLNIFVLPLIIFDIPIYRGKNLKEILTFSEREITSSLFFKIFRHAITPVLIIASFLSPFFLNPPYTSSITFEKMIAPKYKDVHTKLYKSQSKFLGLSLNTEINNQLMIIPSFENNKMGLILYDLKNNESISMHEHKRISHSKALYQLRYANPLSSLYLPDHSINNFELKNKSVKSLQISLTSILPGIKEFGPFLANAFLFKKLFLNDSDNFLVNIFTQNNPAIKVNVSTQQKKERVFLFAKNEILEFSLNSAAKNDLAMIFTQDVLGALQYDQSNKIDLDNPQVLEVVDAFINSNYRTILTYYINEAKKVKDLNNPKWQAFLLKNLVQTKEVLLADKSRIGMNKNIEKSLDNIINSLSENGKKIK
ncbi:MAG: FHA domain-containing protein [Bacteriovorax sp.]|nr:FHA domain-containing protein [Bacteriovorax sp.]